MYVVDNKEYSYNSDVNREIKAKFVERNVYANVTDMVNDLRRASYDCSSIEWGDEYFKNLTYDTCPECFQEVRKAEDSDLDTIAKETGKSPEEIDLDDYFVCDFCGHIMTVYDTVSKCHEVYEWYLVNSYFGKELEAHDEIVLERFNNDWIWGRCGTGQQIMFDEVIDDIAKKRGILDGQKNSWAKHVG